MSQSLNSIRLPNRLRRKRALISLTPLIDVVFILLIFLMLVSSFLDRKAFEISMGGAGDTPALKSDKPPLQLHLSEDGKADLDGTRFSLSDIDRTLTRATRQEKNRVVMVRSDKGVDLQTVVSVMSAARKIPGMTVFLVRRPQSPQSPQRP